MSKLKCNCKDGYHVSHDCWGAPESSRCRRCETIDSLTKEDVIKLAESFGLKITKKSIGNMM